VVRKKLFNFSLARNSQHKYIIASQQDESLLTKMINYIP